MDMTNAGYACAVCGDFNGRTGHSLDYVEHDVIEHLPVDEGYIGDTVLPQRVSQDTVVI